MTVILPDWDDEENGVGEIPGQLALSRYMAVEEMIKNEDY